MDEMDTSIKEKHLIAIRLRYEGKSNKEISEEVELKEGTVANYFAQGGLLYELYNQHVKQQNQKVIDVAGETLKKSTGMAAEWMEKIFKRVRDRIDYYDREIERLTPKIMEKGMRSRVNSLIYKRASEEDRLFEMAQKMLDRGGMPVVKKTEMDLTDKRQQLDEDEVDAELKRLGVDPTKVTHKQKAPDRKS